MNIEKENNDKQRRMSLHLDKNVINDEIVSNGIEIKRSKNRKRSLELRNIKSIQNFIEYRRRFYKLNKFKNENEKENEEDSESGSESERESGNDTDDNNKEKEEDLSFYEKYQDYENLIYYFRAQLILNVITDRKKNIDFID